MLYTHSEIKEKYKSTYQIRKALEKKEIFKLEKGIYSDKPSAHYLSVIMKKYPYGTIASHSAYYYYDLTDVIPEKIFLATNRNSTTINYNGIKQIRMTDDLYKLGKTQIEYEGALVNIYDKERMLIELARNKNQMGYDLYKEIVSNYRKIANDLDIYKLEKYLRHFTNEDKIFKIIQDEVF